MTYESVLFIGGPWDGKFVSLEYAMDYFEVRTGYPKPYLDMTTQGIVSECKKVIYKHETIISYGKTYHVYVSPDVTDIIERLIYNYKQNKDNNEYEKA
jgi:hypothetical protein